MYNEDIIKDMLKSNLNKNDVIKILGLYYDGMSPTAIEEAYNLSKGFVAYIRKINGKLPAYKKHI